MNHIKQNLSSGLEVYIRSRTWPEYDEFEKRRFADMKGLLGLSGLEMEIARQELVHGMRVRLFDLTVKDFAGIAAKLSLRDVDELEEAVLAMERREVPMGNSEPGGAGQATPSGNASA